jgi:type IV pilus assembly protein PilB
VVGPTGSGKSTTLYAGLQLLAADPSRKVISVEDPIEYALAGVQQCQVLPEVGFTFANAMRAFVREDPDVILVGEIRDAETALEAIRASQTGHLVLSTLHCNDSVDAVQRLLDLGSHPNSIGSELLAVIAQRLAKRICPSCRTETEPDPELAQEVFPLGVPQGFRTWKGTGCSHCGGHGTRGRIAVAELLQVSADFRLAISHHLPVDDLREVARRSGLRPLRDEALSLVQRGIIEFIELRDLLTGEHLAGPPASSPAEVAAGNGAI